MSGHVSPKGVYYAIFGSLMVLTVVTVVVATVNLGHLNFPRGDRHCHHQGHARQPDNDRFLLAQFQYIPRRRGGCTAYAHATTACASCRGRRRVRRRNGMGTL